MCRDKPNNPQVARPRTGYPISNYKPKKQKIRATPTPHNKKKKKERAVGTPFLKNETKDPKCDAARGSKRKEIERNPPPILAHTPPPPPPLPPPSLSYFLRCPAYHLRRHTHTHTVRNLACLLLFVLLCHMFLFLSLSPCCAQEKEKTVVWVGKGREATDRRDARCFKWWFLVGSHFGVALVPFPSPLLYHFVCLSHTLPLHSDEFFTPTHR